MWFLKLSLMVLAYLVCLPVNLLISYLVKALWRPAYTADIATTFTATAFDIGDLSNRLALARRILDVDMISVNGDGPKFLGLAYVATDDDAILQVLTSYIGESTLYRSPGGDLERRGILPVFSGDQVGAFLWAMVTAKQRGRLDEVTLAALKRVMDNVLFSNVPFVFPDVNGKCTVGRGWLWTPWEPTHSTFDIALGALAACNELWGDTDPRYMRWYRVMKIIGYPVSFSHDVSFFCGTKYVKAWYTEHTAMIALMLRSAGAGDISVNDAAEEMYRKYPWNPDIALIYGAYFDRAETDALATVSRAVCSYDPVWRMDGVAPDLSPIETQEYFSLRSFEHKTMAKSVASPSMRLNTNYMWEENPLSVSASVRPGWTADFLFTAGVLSALTNNVATK